MLRLRHKAISASNVKSALLLKVKRPLKLFFLFVSKKHWELSCMQLKTSCTLQEKTFQVPSSLQIFGKSAWKIEKWGTEPKLTEVYGKTPTDFIRIWIRLWKSLSNWKISSACTKYEIFIRFRFIWLVYGKVEEQIHCKWC